MATIQSSKSIVRETDALVCFVAVICGCKPLSVARGGAYGAACGVAGSCKSRPRSPALHAPSHLFSLVLIFGGPGDVQVSLIGIPSCSTWKMMIFILKSSMLRLPNGHLLQSVAIACAATAICAVLNLVRSRVYANSPWTQKADVDRLRTF